APLRPITAPPLALQRRNRSRNAIAAAASSCSQLWERCGMQRHILAGSIHQALFAAAVIACSAFGSAYAQDATAAQGSGAAPAQGAADGQPGGQQKRDGKD